MITVEQAEELILNNAVDYGAEIVPFDDALGRVLAETIKADRDLPPFNRVSMDGIGIDYSAIEKGYTTFIIRATQAAGDAPVDIENEEECIEIMTGAALPSTIDTIVRYEDIEIKDGKALLKTINIKKGQNIHLQGVDRRKGDLVLTSGKVITPAVISMVASVGETELRVKRKPRVVIISSGDELVDVAATPLPYQIRRSNSYMMKGILAGIGIDAGMVHIPDNLDAISVTLQQCLINFDVLLLSGGISMGKFDYIPEALKQLNVKQIFHKVQQRPGKPFWFGRHKEGPIVFAFPGNPVATFMCTQRYFMPWLNASLGIKTKPAVYAVLNADFVFQPKLKYFLQVTLEFAADGRWLATPVEGNGSGDFANLVDTDAFMELPLNKTKFKKGEVYRIWTFNHQ